MFAWALLRADLLPPLGWLSRWWPAVASLLLFGVAFAAWRRGREPRATEPAVRRDWTQVITATTALGALIFTALSLRATQEQIEVAEQGQITDRYAKAVELLGTPGSEHFQVRLGGIYALERLAADSPRDQQTVVDVLSAFIRATSPWTDRTKPCPPARADIQAAFTAISRRDVSQDPRYPVGSGASPTTTKPIDLRNTCLAELIAFNADLTRMTLVGADLSRADLGHAHGGLVSLVDAKLTGANLRGADLSNFAFLDRADLSDARLTEAKIGPLLTGVNLANADLRGADLSYATLTGVVLTGAKHDDKTNTEGAKYDAATVGAWW